MWQPNFGAVLNCSEIQEGCLDLCKVLFHLWNWSVKERVVFRNWACTQGPRHTRTHTLRPVALVLRFWALYGVGLFGVALLTSFLLLFTGAGPERPHGIPLTKNKNKIVVLGRRKKKKKYEDCYHDGEKKNTVGGRRMSNAVQRKGADEHG